MSENQLVARCRGTEKDDFESQGRDLTILFELVSCMWDMSAASKVCLFRGSVESFGLSHSSAFCGNICDCV